MTRASGTVIGPVGKSFPVSTASEDSSSRLSPEKFSSVTVMSEMTTSSLSSSNEVAPLKPMTPNIGFASGAFVNSAAASASIDLKPVHSLNCGW